MPTFDWTGRLVSRAELARCTSTFCITLPNRASVNTVQTVGRTCWACRDWDRPRSPWRPRLAAPRDWRGRRADTSTCLTMPRGNRTPPWRQGGLGETRRGGWAAAAVGLVRPGVRYDGGGGGRVRRRRG